jgi:PAS domain S-box-containing protein
VGRDVEDVGMGSVAERLAAAFDASSVAMGLVATDGTWLRFNERLCELLRTDRASLAARLPRDLIHPDDREAAVLATARLLSGEVGAVDAERRYLRADGRLLRARVTTSLVRRPDGSADSLLTQLVAVSGARAAQDGYRDPVTGAVTQDALTRHVGLAQQRARRHDRMLVLISAEVAGPDPATPQGARVLSCLAQRMTGVVRGSDLVGRSGPARLTVACEGLRDDDEILVVLNRLAHAMAEPVDVDGEVSSPDVHLGVSVATEGEHARDLVTRPGWPAPAPAERPTGRRARHGVSPGL